MRLRAARYDGGMKRPTALLVCLLLIPACGSGDGVPVPDGVTTDEARALEEAEEMLEERRMRPEESAPNNPKTIEGAEAQ